MNFSKNFATSKNENEHTLTFKLVIRSLVILLDWNWRRKKLESKLHFVSLKEIWNTFSFSHIKI